MLNQLKYNGIFFLKGNLSLKELWDPSISKTIHRENNKIILENLEGNLTYIPILREYEDILKRIIKQLIIK